MTLMSYDVATETNEISQYLGIKNQKLLIYLCSDIRKQFVRVDKMISNGLVSTYGLIPHQFIQSKTYNCT